MNHSLRLPIQGAPSPPKRRPVSHATSVATLTFVRRLMSTARRALTRGLRVVPKTWKVSSTTAPFPRLGHGQKPILQSRTTGHQEVILSSTQSGISNLPTSRHVSLVVVVLVMVAVLVVVAGTALHLAAMPELTLVLTGKAVLLLWPLQARVVIPGRTRSCKRSDPVNRLQVHEKVETSAGCMLAVHITPVVTHNYRLDVIADTFFLRGMTDAGTITN